MNRVQKNKLIAVLCLLSAFCVLDAFVIYDLCKAWYDSDWGGVVWHGFFFGPILSLECISCWALFQMWRKPENRYKD